MNVEVRDGGPGAGLALYAIKDVQQGDVLLSLPTDLGFRRTSSVGVMVGQSQQQWHPYGMVGPLSSAYRHSSTGGQQLL